MKGVILGGGSGTRLRPITKYLNKHLFPVYDRPMILFPIETMKTLGITDIILLIDRYGGNKLMEFLGSGIDFDINLTYKVQEKPNGIASAIDLVKPIIGNDNMLVILGDNLIFEDIKEDVSSFRSGCKVFLKKVSDPERFGVPELDEKNRIVKIVEKPNMPPSSYAITGIYLFDNTVFEKIAKCKPSTRGEFEITDVLNMYAGEQRLDFRELQNVWIDAGTFESLFNASAFVREFEKNP